jgi:hypothetical protein
VAINVGQYLSSGHWWEAESCEGPSDNSQSMSNDDLADLLANWSGLPAGTTLPVYPTGPICNTRGLTDLGAYLIQRMMERGLVIHLDHMSVATATAVLDLAERTGYRGLMAAHTWSDPAITARIARLGGMITAYAAPASYSTGGGFLGEWLANEQAAGPLAGYSYGSDMNGLAPQGWARSTAGSDPLVYPFTAPNGAVLDKAVWGQKTWDYNTDGVAQYGLYAVWVADAVAQAGQLDAGLYGGCPLEGASCQQRFETELMNSAEAYTQMWEAARAWTN